MQSVFCVLAFWELYSGGGLSEYLVSASDCFSGVYRDQECDKPICGICGKSDSGNPSGIYQYTVESDNAEHAHLYRGSGQHGCHFDDSMDLSQAHGEKNVPDQTAADQADLKEAQSNDSEIIDMSIRPVPDTSMKEIRYDDLEDDKVQYIENPLPVPKRREHKEMDYAFETTGSDDYDIKDLSDKDFYDIE